MQRWAAVVLLVLLQLSLSGRLLPVAFAAFPDCEKGVGSKWPICDPSLSPSLRARDLVSRMNLTERFLRLGYDTADVPRLGLPHYSFGTEGLHGVASGTQFTQSGDFSSSSLFPAPINSAAAFDRSLWNDIATWISNEARAFSNADRTGLHFWSLNTAQRGHDIYTGIHTYWHAAQTTAAQCSLSSRPVRLSWSQGPQHQHSARSSLGPLTRDVGRGPLPDRTVRAAVRARHARTAWTGATTRW